MKLGLRARFAIAGVATLGLSLSMVACSADAGSQTTNDAFSFTTVQNAEQYALDHGYSKAAKILADGVVTQDEYRAAEKIYRTCLIAEGYEFGPVTVDPVGGLRLVYEGGGTYQGPKGKADVPAINKCQDAYDPVEESYTLSQPQRMDPPLLAAVEQCLTDAGVPFDKSATNVKTLAGGASSPSQPLVKCITDETMRLYPSLPGVGIGY